MELPDADRVRAPDGGEVVRRAARRQARHHPRVTRQEAEDRNSANGLGQAERHGRRHIPRLHRVAVEHPDLHVLERARPSRREDAGRHVDPVRPDAELRVVGELAAALDLHRVEVPAARHWIGARGHRYALVHRAARVVRPGEVRDDPAVAERVVDDDRVALVVVVAGSARRRLAEEAVEGEGGDAAAGALVEDADRGIDRLDVVGRPDVAVRIGRPPGAPVGEVEAGEGARRRRRRRGG